MQSKLIDVCNVCFLCITVNESTQYFTNVFLKQIIDKIFLVYTIPEHNNFFEEKNYFL